MSSTLVQPTSQPAVTPVRPVVARPAVRRRFRREWLWALFFLGPFLEITIKTPAFVGIYFASLIGGSLWTYMEHFRDLNYRALGASGAVSGITLAAALFYPLATILVFFAPAEYSNKS